MKAKAATRAARTLVERTQAVEEPPPDQFHVVVENDMNDARLLWLGNRIGEAKLRKSVAKCQNRWLRLRHGCRDVFDSHDSSFP